VEETLFREIDHTADLGIEVEGDTVQELFRRAGLALFSLMVSLEGVETREEREVLVEAEGWEDLIHDWLSRLLHIFLLDGFIAQTIEVTGITAERVEARLWGEKLDFERHDFYTEIKAVTYHQLSVSQSANGCWQARIIFDV
jgi:SHS2 domain-containing protein